MKNAHMLEKQADKSLHRLKNGNHNDWDNVETKDLTFLQKIAKKTKGVITIGNAITLSGTVMVLNGLYNFVNGNKALGVAEVVAGRGLDVADGIAADMSKTKGRTGRDLDAGVDGVQLLVALPVLDHVGVLPTVVAATVVTSKLIDAAGTFAAKARKREINPTKEGKLGTGALWAGIGSFMLHAILDKHIPEVADNILETMGWAGTIGGTVYKVPATIEYASIGFGRQSNTNTTE